MRVGEPCCQLRGRSRVCFKVLLFISWLFFSFRLLFHFFSFFLFFVCVLSISVSLFGYRYYSLVSLFCFFLWYFSAIPEFSSFFRGKTSCLSRVILSSNNFFFLCLIYISFFFLYIPSSTNISHFPPFAFLLKGVRFIKGERVRSDLQPFFTVRVFLLRK